MALTIDVTACLNLFLENEKARVRRKLAINPHETRFETTCLEKEKKRERKLIFFSREKNSRDRKRKKEMETISIFVLRAKIEKRRLLRRLSLCEEGIK